MLKTRTGGVAAVVLAAVSCAHAQDAVQWRVEDGGNGHWYALTDELRPWAFARSAAEDLGAHLATLTSEMENDFAVSLGISNDIKEYWLGAQRDMRSPSPLQGWSWITDEPWDWTNWRSGEPNNTTGSCYPNGEPWLEIQPSGLWNDEGYSCSPSQTNRSMLEWSADCNGDGLVDYGQILDGTYADKDGNGVPDCCERDCPGDLNGDDSVGPPDLGILLAVWGTDGGKISGADLNGDGIVNAADLGLLVGAWGDCGCN
jgi:hypothetical protein